MSAKLLDGNLLGKKLLEDIRRDITALGKAAASICLATLQIGDSKDATIYSNYLKKLLEGLGLSYKPVKLAAEADEDRVFAELATLKKDDSVTGIMVFAPIPKQLNYTAVFDHLALNKDVEGRTFLKSHYGVFSPTAHAVLALLESAHIDFRGKEAVVVGHSDLVGKPTAVLLSDKLATVAICHRETKDLESHVRRADLVVAAAGKPELIKGAWIKTGAVVIDVGENVAGGKIVGDVEFEEASKRASFISPVPGGVGPVTNVMLLRNLVNLHRLRENGNGTRGS